MTERAAVERVLELGDVNELDVLRAQLAAGSAVEECSCVCPSITISVDQEHAPRARTWGKPAATADYDGGSIMVWVEDGWISLLEIYSWSDEAPTAFRPLDQLAPSGCLSNGRLRTQEDAWMSDAEAGLVPPGPPNPPAPPGVGEPETPDPADRGAPVVVRFDDTVLGDLGHVRVDAAMLTAILQRGGRAAAWLSEQGVTLDTVRRDLPAPGH